MREQNCSLLNDLTADHDRVTSLAGFDDFAGIARVVESSTAAAQRREGEVTKTLRRLIRWW